MKEYRKNCKCCGRELIYKYKYPSELKILLSRKDKLCMSCSKREFFKKNPEARRKISERSKLMIGEKNPFFGKKHSKETIEKMKNTTNRSFTKTKEYKEKISKATKGEKNPMYGRNVYSIWVQKYGKEIADQKKEELKKRQSIIFSGKNNPMFGKPSPKYSGNGWKGWYNEIFFRSLRELCFIMYLEDNNLKWKRGETKEFQIKYKDWTGKERNYYPDFIVDDIIYEIKPKKLWNTPSVLAKTNAAIEFANNNNYTFLIIDQNIDFKKIKSLFEKGIIKFEEKTEIKFLKYNNNKF